MATSTTSPPTPTTASTSTTAPTTDPSQPHPTASTTANGPASAAAAAAAAPPQSSSASPTQPTPTFTLLLFAAASTHCATDSLTLHAPMSLSQLFEELETKFPNIKAQILSRAMLTRNLEYLDVEVSEVGEVVGGEEKGVVFREGDEVGVLMAVSSG